MSVLTAWSGPCANALHVKIMPARNLMDLTRTILLRNARLLPLVTVRWESWAAASFLLCASWRNNPEEHLAAQVGFLIVGAFDLGLLQRLPVAHVKGVRHDARAWLKLFEQLRAKLQVDVRQ